MPQNPPSGGLRAQNHVSRGLHPNERGNLQALGTPVQNWVSFPSWHAEDVRQRANWRVPDLLGRRLPSCALQE